MNELTSLLKRAFEALGYKQADYEDAARAIVWLESRGMHGLELAMRDWQRLHNAGHALEITATGTDVDVVDAHDSSVLTCGRPVADLLMARLVQKRRSRIEVRQCYSRMAILPTLELCTRRGAGAVAYWNDGDHQHVAWIDAHRANPEYRRMTTKPDTTTGMATLNIECSTEPGEVEAVLMELVKDDPQLTTDHHVSPAEMDAHYEDAVQRGIAVSGELVARLTATADAVLVAATERSRRGAGEASS